MPQDLILAGAVVLADAVRSAPVVDYVFVGATGSTIKFAKVDAVAGSNTIVAAVTGKKIRVLAYRLQAIQNGASTKASYQWRSDVNAIAGRQTLVNTIAADKNDLIHEDSDPTGLFETVAGELLAINITAADSDLRGYIKYVEV